MNKKVSTIRDVAAAAGVSTATVSKFISGTQHFSPAVEEKLRAVIKDLGYISNPAAQSMITGRTKSIGLIIPDISNPHFTSIIKGANRITEQHGYTLLLGNTGENPDRERPLLDALSRRVDGMLVFSRLPESEMEWMLLLQKPLVFFGRLTQLQLPTVASDDRLGGYMIAQYLHGLGHKKIAYIGFSKSRRNEERLGGVKDGLLEKNVSLNCYDSVMPSTLEGERLCSTIMLGPDRPDALICYNDLIALGFMKEAQALGFRLPGDISVAGFDNIEFGRYTFPPLTTVDLQSEQMGVSAAEKLFTLIDGGPASNMTTIEPRLIVRMSTVSRP